MLSVSLNKTFLSLSYCSLGSGHDGLSNECSGADQYIMAASSRSRSDPNMTNPWHFSPCSVTYFKIYLTKLLDTELVSYRDTPELVVVIVCLAIESILTTKVIKRLNYLVADILD